MYDNDNQPRDPYVDRPFAIMVIVALACFVGMVLVLFPRHDATIPGPGQPTAPGRGGGGLPAQTIETPTAPK